MQSWLDIDISANYFKSSYYEGFIDISGGGIHVRNSGNVDVHGKFMESGVPIDQHYASIDTPSFTGNMTTNGNITSTRTISAANFHNLSDYRIKSEVVSIVDTTFSLDKLCPKYYLNTQLNTHDIGFLAHEVQSELPFLVNGEKDGDELQTINYTGLIGLMVSEIQQLKQLCETYNTRIIDIERR
jgi:hypothetical protein